MVLRCSLLGHDYGEIDVEREREERGSEVVVTVQEFEECARCGDRHVISENTEVTSLSAQTAADALPDEYDLESETPPTESPSEPPAETATDVSDAGDDVDDDAAEFIDADDDGEPTATTAAGNDPAASAETLESTDELDVPTDENGEPITDDGEILEDEEPSPDRDREHGQWPDSDDVGPPIGAENEPNEWPDDGPVDGAGDERDGDDTADVDVTDDGILLGEDAGDERESPAAASARSTTSSMPTTSDSNQMSQSDEPEATGSGIERAGSAPTPGESPTAEREDVPTEFYCPSCEYVAASDRASLRTGDICPECKKGYLGERER